MAASHQHLAFLCGHFTRRGTTDYQRLEQLGWNLFHLPDDIRATQKRFFYPDYVDFSYGEDSKVGCVRMVRHINVEQQLVVRGQTLPFAIKELTLYLMPFDLVLYSIHVEQEVEDLNDATALMFSLRSIDYYTEAHQAFVQAVIRPLEEAYALLTGNAPASRSELIENGNKLRIFQIINSHDDQLAKLGEEQKDKLLYELATVSRVTRPGEDDANGPSESYLQRMIDSGKVSVFRNWSAMALMDTFTIHSYDADSRLVDNWSDSYFRTIYVHCIFRKCYLFNLNIRFKGTLKQQSSKLRSALQNFSIISDDVTALVDEFELFEQRCCFHKISYNFLPLEVLDAIDRGLAISEEMDQLSKIMEKEKEHRDERNDKMVNTLLLSLSMLTLFSAIWDISCLVDQMYPYTEYLGGQTLGYRTVSLFLLMAVLLLLLIIYRSRGKK